MKVIKKDPEVMNRRCEKLQRLGFRILHNDSRVDVPIGNDEYVECDFSGIDENKFVEVALRKVFIKGVDIGEYNLRNRFQQLLGLK